MPRMITQVIELVNTKVIHASDEIQAMETVGVRLKRLREAAGLSQAELARRAGYKSQGAIGNIEAGDRGYGDGVLKVAKALGVDPYYLACETDELGVAPLVLSAADSIRSKTTEILNIAAALPSDVRKSTADMLSNYILHPAANSDMLPVLVARLSGEFSTERDNPSPRAA